LKENGIYFITSGDDGADDLNPSAMWFSRKGAKTQSGIGICLRLIWVIGLH